MHGYANEYGMASPPKFPGRAIALAIDNCDNRAARNAEHAEIIDEHPYWSSTRGVSPRRGRNRRARSARAALHFIQDISDRQFELYVAPASNIG